MSKLGGIPDYPFVILPHPMAHLSDEDLRDYAVRAAPDTLRILLAKG